MMFNKCRLTGLLIFLFCVVCSSPLKAETIRFAITHWRLKVGEATLSNVGPVDYQGQRVFLINFKAQAVNFFDEEKIYTDPVRFYPLYVQRDLNIFGKKEKILEVYDRTNNEIRLTKTVENKKIQQVFKKSGAMDNIYGFILRYRKNGAFKIGDMVNVPLPTLDLKIQLVRRMNLMVMGQSYESFYMQSRPAKYKIWFDTSPEKKPLRINGAIGMSLVMEMIGYEK